MSRYLYESTPDPAFCLHGILIVWYFFALSPALGAGVWWDQSRTIGKIKEVKSVSSHPSSEIKGFLQSRCGSLKEESGEKKTIKEYPDIREQ